MRLSEPGLFEKCCHQQQSPMPPSAAFSPSPVLRCQMLVNDRRIHEESSVTRCPKPSELLATTLAAVRADTLRPGATAFTIPHHSPAGPRTPPPKAKPMPMAIALRVDQVSLRPAHPPCSRRLQALAPCQALRQPRGVLASPQPQPPLLLTPPTGEGVRERATGINTLYRSPGAGERLPPQRFARSSRPCSSRMPVRTRSVTSPRGHAGNGDPRFEYA